VPPAAYADPPDPSWIGGFWDDDDFDTVIAFIASTCAILTPTFTDTQPLFVSIASVPPGHRRALRTPCYSFSESRAPPVGLTSHC
jgi:hypothetical protein